MSDYALLIRPTGLVGFSQHQAMNTIIKIFLWTSGRIFDTMDRLLVCFPSADKKKFPDGETSEPQVRVKPNATIYS